MSVEPEEPKPKVTPEFMRELRAEILKRRRVEVEEWSVVAGVDPDALEDWLRAGSTKKKTNGTGETTL